MKKIKMTGTPGLSVKNGRLINERPDCVIGIQKIAMAIKALKREEKISMVAEGYRRAEMTEE
jgi:hypothetical protein